MSKIVGNIVGNALDLSNLKTNGIADLSQNDPNGEGYVKNRTHWKEVNGVDIVAFPEATVELTSGNNMVNGFVKNSFIEGNKYKVIWNGTEYECICYVEDGTYLLGNGVYLGLTTEKDYPFCIGSYNGAVGFVGKGTETDETITLKIYSKQETIYHKLDKEYLPDDIGGGSAPDILLSDGVIIPETEVVLDEPWGSGTQSYIHSDLIPTVGETYEVFWNGTKYSCVAKQSGISDADVDIILGNGLSFGLPATEEPFCLRFYYAVAGDTQLTVVVASFDALETVNLRVALPPMIDPKYIPNMYYEEGGWVEVLPETKLTAPYPEGEPGMFVIEENYPELVIGTTYKVKWNGAEYTGTAVDGSSMGGPEGSVVLCNDGADLSTGEGVVFAILYVAGQSFMIQDATGANELTVSIFAEGKTIHHIPPKFIKDMYGEEEVELFPETALTFAENDGMMMTLVENPPFVLEAGKTYKVIYNGTEYTCECDPEPLAIGNFGALIGGELTGEPFVVVCEDGVLIVVSLSYETTATMSIRGYVVNKINSKYIDFSDAVPVFDISNLVEGSNVVMAAFTRPIISALEKGPVVFQVSLYGEKVMLLVLNASYYGVSGQFTAGACNVHGETIDNYVIKVSDFDITISRQRYTLAVTNVANTELYLKSSGNKQFKITVDDDGNLTATER